MIHEVSIWALFSQHLLQDNLRINLTVESLPAKLTYFMALALILIFLLTFTCLVGSSDLAVAVDVDVNGEYISATSKLSISATFSNLFNNDTLLLYWAAEKYEDDVFISFIEPNGQSHVTTYSGHSFYAVLESKNDVRAYPGSVTVGATFSDGEDFSYSFGPDPPAWSKGTLHPKVKYINQVSLSIGARFKSLAPSIDIWYEDGKDGSYQGSLKMGQETTTNTYVGHVFYFTEAGNKKNELARHVMRKEQVDLPLM